MEVLKDFKNELLKRREIEVVETSKSNPGFENARKLIIGEFKTPEDTIVVNGIKGGFGSNNFVISTFIYDSKEDKNDIERKSKKEKEAEKKKEEEGKSNTGEEEDDKKIEQISEDTKDASNVDSIEKPVKQTKEEESEENNKSEK